MAVLPFDIVVVVLIGLLIWALVRSRARRAQARRQAGTGPTVLPRVPQAHNQGGRTPPAAGDPGRRPMLTVAAEIAGILGLFIALIALISTR
ncbi:hypothetical protein [Streptomyces sp. N50]|uniref:hypothetical protein n=1 Tax=Streptomyces sp. N50 TaxID=3081765 RepID=UPI002961F0AA|nr:hypothetical protein [Streptomyces sp. N50]WOX10187.1 hypothetical protein R2B38_15585 [Streptomyces sp. N50]